MENFNFISNVKLITDFESFYNNKILKFGENIIAFKNSLTNNSPFFPNNNEITTFKTIDDIYNLQNKLKIEKNTIIEILNQTELPKELLKKIWLLSFSTSFNDDLYFKDELYLALQYVMLAQNNKDINKENLIHRNPNNKLKIDNKEISHNESHNNITDELFENNVKKILTINSKLECIYLSFIESLNLTNKNKISGHEIKNITFLNKIENKIKYNLWKLSDFRKSGNLNEKESMVFVHLLNLVINDIYLPDVLPSQLKNYIQNNNINNLKRNENIIGISSDNLKNNKASNSNLNTKTIDNIVIKDNNSFINEILNNYKITLDKFNAENNEFFKKIKNFNSKEKELLEKIKLNLNILLLENNKIELLKLSVSNIISQFDANNKKVNDLKIIKDKNDISMLISKALLSPLDNNKDKEIKDNNKKIFNIDFDDII